MSNLGIAWTIAKKDMKGITSNIQVWFPMVIIPILIGILFPGGLVVAANFFDSGQIAQGKEDYLLNLVEKMKGTSLYMALKNFSTLNQQVVYFVVNYLFISLFILIPVMTSSVVSANSFVGEKERKTLESLLMAPIEIRTLFLGKLLSAFIPTMAITLGTFLLYGIVVNAAAYPMFGSLIFPTGNWFILIFWLIPILSICIIFLNVIISARVKTFQEAYQLGGMVVLPILLLMASQLTGFLFLNGWVLFLMGGILLAVNLWLLQVISKWNDRVVLTERQI